MTTIENYAQQATQPEWFNANSNHLYASATSGTSPFNEWYEFASKEEAVAFINNTFSSQSFVDRYTEHNGEFYDNDDCEYNEETEEYVPTKDAEPASIDELVATESRF